MTALLPTAVGPISRRVRHLLETGNEPGDATEILTTLPEDPLDLDAQLALFMLHELSYSGWEDAVVDERALSVVEFTNQLNTWFETTLREAIDLPSSSNPIDVVAETIAAPASSIARYLAERGTIEQLAESLVLRSPYQSKEADPHTRAIPRLEGRAKSALIEIQSGEYGVGHRFSHAELFARALEALGLDTTPAVHVNSCSGAALATSNLVSMTASQRRLRGALLGQLCLIEMDSVGPNELMVAACDRLAAPDDVRRFFQVHVLADDEHEDVAADGFLGAFVEDEPDQTPELVFGTLAQALIDRRHANDTIGAWRNGRSALRTEAVHARSGVSATR